MVKVNIACVVCSEQYSNGHRTILERLFAGCEIATTGVFEMVSSDVVSK